GRRRADHGCLKCFCPRCCRGLYCVRHTGAGLHCIPLLLDCGGAGGMVYWSQNRRGGVPVPQRNPYEKTRCYDMKMKRWLALALAALLAVGLLAGCGGSGAVSLNDDKVEAFLQE